MSADRRQLKTAFSLCLEFLIVTDRKDLEKLLSLLKINCCKAALQLPGGARSVPSPSLHQTPQIEHEIKCGS